MDDPEIPAKRRSPEPEIQVAAAAVAAALSPPLGIAVAAGSALRSRRVREALRKGTVSTLAGAMQLGDQLSAAATARAAAMKAEPPTETDEHEPASSGSAVKRGAAKSGSRSGSGVSRGHANPTHQP